MHHAAQGKRCYEFGSFRLDTGNRLLLRDGVPVSLTLKSYELLAVLVEHWGKVLDKGKLMELVWPNSFVEEANLSQNIYLLRKALGDDKNGSTYISTIPKRGYRFVMHVQELPAAIAERENQLTQGFGKPAGLSMTIQKDDPVTNACSIPSVISPIMAGAGSVETPLSVTSSTLEELKKEFGSGPQAEATSAVQSARHFWMWAATAIVVVAIGLVVWLLRSTAGKPAPAPEVIPLTSYLGSERSPNFSPDGNQVAFSWNGEKEDNFDIYIKLIGSPAPIQLTTGPADDVSPAFSPDGRSIGFVRLSKKHASFVVIPSIGGPERVVAEIAVPRSLTGMRVFSWLPNGKWVVVEGLALLSTETGEQRNLTSPPSKGSLDYSPAVSPDGRTVAFSRESSSWISNIYLLDVTEDLKPKGEPRQLTFLKGNSHVPTWTPNGKEIIFASFFFGSGISLWRVPVSGGGEPEKLPITGGETDCPAISRTGNRLAYQRNGSSDSDIWRLPLSGPGVASGPRLGSLPPRAMRVRQNTLLTASGSPLNPSAVETMPSGSAMQTAPTPWNCSPEQASASVPGRRAGRPMGNGSPSILILRETSISMLSEQVEESRSA
jgi:DNA-binding winged helix-turn-helix (wHTH) protein/Tol biopolymer transport system component